MLSAVVPHARVSTAAPVIGKLTANGCRGWGFSGLLAIYYEHMLTYMVYYIIDGPAHRVRKQHRHQYEAADP